MVESAKLEKPREGLIRQELISYERKNGKIYRKEEVREYFKDGDYQDHYTTIFIGDENEWFTN